MAVGDNNPRVFAQTIALDAWRTPFDGEHGEADLHIDVVFKELGPVGGGDAPVRFRLSLKRADIHVVLDTEDILDIKRSSVRRAAVPEPAKGRHVTEKKSKIGAGVEGEASAKPTGLSGSLGLKGNAETSLIITDKLEKALTVHSMQVVHSATVNGYSFSIAPSKTGAKLVGQPWDANSEPVMKIIDKNFTRKRGEPPEVRVEIQCRREDMVIEHVEFTDKTFPSWARLPHKKRIAVEQYIRDEITKAGFPYGDLSDPFMTIVLADAVPSIEQ